MTNLRMILVASITICAVCNLLAQPNVTPAAGYEWVLMGTDTYTSPTVSTVPGGVGVNTGYGQPGDSDPASCANYCGGNCDGDGTIGNIVFGSITSPSSTCEQRAVLLDHWNNTNPESSIANGATAGTVYLPTSSTVNILNSRTGAGGGNNRAWIIGGNGSPNTSQFNTQVDYSLNWHVAEYNLTGGSGNQDYDFAWTAGDPGNNQEVETNGWNNNSTDGFGMAFDDVLSVPTSSVIETGGTFEVIFEANSSIMIGRDFGNADGRVQHNPGMEGTANYVVNYDIWVLETTLPVEFSYIKAHLADEAIVVNWATAMEVNSERFIVERSVDGAGWTALGEVVAAGNTDSSTAYTYIDKKATKGELRYRLLQIDLDGLSSYSPTAVIKVEATGNPLELYPTAADHQITVDGITGDVAHNNIMDTNGVSRQSGDVADGESIDIVDLEAGVYFISIVENAGVSARSLKFIKI